ncbi:hypothetical protein MNBD_IGNAVI01-2544 [hydrothermal vent metagenome]|uniref:Outer membrane protein beta-barrel domain-containing protein n=1 Tax=hydrothermal vent metagenome TaxID=652676 RepID=A0A3B1CC04_9ZZZZ
MKFFKLLLLSSLLFIGTINAQKGVMKIEPSLVIAFPVAGTNTGFGINGTFFYGINKNIDLTGTLGYISWGYSGIDASFTSIPVLFGGRYSFDVQGSITPYAAAELGFHFTSASFTIPDFGFGYGGGTTSASSTEFGLGFGGGAYFQVSDNITIDGNLQYNIIGSSNYFAIRAGAVFGI